ncbi:MAG: nicotinate-nucleotide adenylyltransferase [Pseudomonadota bacterium]
MTQSGRRIGLLGGSFNPAHGGHRRITCFTMDALDLDAAWWLVSPGNPLKKRAGMASYSARFQSAQEQARRAPIVPTSIERALKTRYTVDTLKALRRRYPRHQFVWLMGADNLAQFHRWRRWRTIARTVPIAVIARPGYNADAMTSPAMAWLRRYSVSAASFRKRRQWSAPALVFLRFDPDHRSATAIRRANAEWASQSLAEPSLGQTQGARRRAAPRDRLLFRRIQGWEEA